MGIYEWRQRGFDGDVVDSYQNGGAAASAGGNE